MLLLKYRGSQWECNKRANAAELLGHRYELRKDEDQWLVLIYEKEANHED